MPYGAYAEKTDNLAEAVIEHVTIELFWVFMSNNYRKLLCELANYDACTTERVVGTFRWNDLTPEQRARLGDLIERFCGLIGPDSSAIS